MGPMDFVSVLLSYLKLSCQEPGGGNKQLETLGHDDSKKNSSVLFTSCFLRL